MKKLPASLFLAFCNFALVFFLGSLLYASESVYHHKQDGETFLLSFSEELKTDGGYCEGTVTNYSKIPILNLDLKITYYDAEGAIVDSFLGELTDRKYQALSFGQSAVFSARAARQSGTARHSIEVKKISYRKSDYSHPYPSISDSDLARAPLKVRAWHLTARGKRYLSMGELEKAEEAYKAVIEFGLADDSVYAGLGEVYLKQGELRKAKEFFIKAVQYPLEGERGKNPFADLVTWPAATFEETLGDICYQLGEYDAAADYYKASHKRINRLVESKQLTYRRAKYHGFENLTFKVARAYQKQNNYPESFGWWFSGAAKMLREFFVGVLFPLMMLVFLLVLIPAVIISIIRIAYRFSPPVVKKRLHALGRLRKDPLALTLLTTALLVAILVFVGASLKAIIGSFLVGSLLAVLVLWRGSRKGS